MSESCFDFVGEDSFTRRGILSTPSNSTQSQARIGFVFVAAGLKYRVGPHAFYVRIARHLAGLGYYALRFDPLGIGESDGQLESGLTADLWKTVEEGRFVKDTLLATRAFKERIELDHVILIGICGGALTSQMAAASSNGLVDGLVSINTAATWSKRSKNHAIKKIGSNELRHNMKSYIKKLISWDAWLRLFRLESEFKDIFWNVFTGMKQLTEKLLGLSNESSLDLNPNFLSSLKKIRRLDLPHLMIFGGEDLRWFEFEESIFASEFKKMKSGNNFKIEVISHANHELSFEDWQVASIQTLTEWIGKTYGVS